MTELLYYSDGYMKCTESTAVKVNGNEVILDKTVFYPECGGQPGDRGTFGPYRISDTRKGSDGTPIHIFEGDVPPVGFKAELLLDWEHRYKYMKEHSAQHLISATMFNEFSIATVSVHQGERILTIETDKPEISEDVLLQIEDSANRHVREGHRIHQEEVDHASAEKLNMRRSIKVDGRVKLVYIDGIDVVACGGVHVGNTMEIGEIRYSGQELIRGHVRTVWSVSDEAVKERRADAKALMEACRLLSSTRESLPSDIERLLGQNSMLKHQVRELSSSAAEREYNDRVAEAESIAAFSTDLPLELFQNIIAPEREVFIACGNAFLYHGTKERFQKIRNALSLRGGGKGSLFRGSFTGSADDIISAVCSILRN